jgi:hypothetical protein
MTSQLFELNMSIDLEEVIENKSRLLNKNLKILKIVVTLQKIRQNMVCLHG